MAIPDLDNLVLAQGAPTPPPKPLPPPSLGSFIYMSVMGAGMGYGLYWITRLNIRLGFLKGEVGSPIASVLFGAAVTGLIEGARGIHAIALRILGDRKEYENLTDPAQTSRLNRFRHQSWKVIASIEKIPHRVDLVFSRLFNIRSGQEIKDQNIQEDDLRFMEVVRRAIGQEVPSLSKLVPLLLANRVVEWVGYKLLFGNNLLSLGGIFCLVGIVNKVHWVYLKKRVLKMQAELAEEAKQQAGASGPSPSTPVLAPAPAN